MSDTQSIIPPLLVGREHELSFLQRLVGEARVGNGWAVAVIGEPGVGKSRLMRDFAATLDPSALPGVRVVQAHAASYGQYSYQLIGQVVRRLYGIAPETSADEVWAQVQTKSAALLAETALSPEEVTEHSALLGALFGVSPDITHAPMLEADARVRLLRQALLRTITAAARAATPLLLILDDMQWADNESVTVLRELVAQIQELPLLLLGIGRTEWLDEAQTLQSAIVNIKALTNDDTARLVQARLGDVPPTLQSLIQKRTEGNPLFIEQAIGYLQDQPQRDYGVLETATGVQDVVQARFDVLPKRAYMLLQHAAVVGVTDGVFPQKIVRSLTTSEAQSGLPDDLALLVQRGFVARMSVNDDNYEIRHSIVRDVAYGALDLEARGLLHEEVGQRIESFYAGSHDLPVEWLASHYALSANDPKAIQYLARSAERAVRIPALREASNRYTEAIIRSRNLLDRDPDELPRLRDLHRALIAVMADHNADDPGFVGMLANVWAVLALCYARLDLVPSTALAYRPSDDHSSDDARIATLEALPLPADAHATYAELCYWLGWVYEWLSRYDTALLWLERGLATPDIPAALVARIANNIGLIHLRQGRMAEAHAYAQRGIDTATTGNATRELAQAYNLAGIIYAEQGNLEVALDLTEKSVHLYADLNDLSGLVKSYNNLAANLNETHRYEDALSYLEKSLKLAQRLKDSRQTLMALGNLSQSLHGQGRTSEAIKLGEETLSLSFEANNLNFATVTYSNLANYSVSEENYKQALRYAEQGIELALRIQATGILVDEYRYKAEAYLGLEQIDNATTAIAQSIEIARQLERVLELSFSYRTKGRIEAAQGHKAEAAESYDKAITTMIEVGAADEARATRLEALAWARKEYLEAARFFLPDGVA